MTFLQKSYGEYSKIEEPLLISMSYEDSDEKEELKTVPIISKNNFENFNSDSTVTLKTKITTKTFSTKILMTKSKRPPKPLSSPSGSSDEKIQALYNDDSNKIGEQAMQEKNAIKNLNLLINLAMVTNDTKPVPEESHYSMNLEIIPTMILVINGKKQTTKDS